MSKVQVAFETEAKRLGYGAMLSQTLEPFNGSVDAALEYGGADETALVSVANASGWSAISVLFVYVCAACIQKRDELAKAGKTDTNGEPLKVYGMPPKVLGALAALYGKTDFPEVFDALKRQAGIHLTNAALRRRDIGKYQALTDEARQIADTSKLLSAISTEGIGTCPAVKSLGVVLKVGRSVATYKQPTLAEALGWTTEPQGESKAQSAPALTGEALPSPFGV